VAKQRRPTQCVRAEPGGRTTRWLPPTVELARYALRTAIADSEEQARHVRAIRAQQTEAFQTFAAGFQRCVGPLPE
jgi:hypothetical protein